MIISYFVKYRNGFMSAERSAFIDVDVTSCKAGEIEKLIKEKIHNNIIIEEVNVINFRFSLFSFIKKLFKK